ncbi:MAG: hypothetical protein V3V92_03180 [Candidatus Hydrothermarchaeales archaeon]
MGIMQNLLFLVLGLITTTLGAKLILTGQAMEILIGLPTGIVGILVVITPHLE